ncbi:VanW family protein [Candidatus Daviesbacteria bacterium]|nr:VanW family protein [Candidatus Daviesbacteria bacterium]
MAKAKKTASSYQLSAIRQKLIRLSILPIILGLTLFYLISLAYQQFIADKYYPQTFVGDTNISLLTEGQAIRKIQSNFNKRSQQKLQLAYPQATFEIDLATSSANLDYSALYPALSVGRSDNLFANLQKQFQILIFTYHIYPKITLSLDKQMDNIEKAVEKEAQDAQLIFDETTTAEGSPSARIQIKESIDGLTLDRQKLQENISQYLLTGKYSSELPLKSIPPKVTTSFALKAKQVLENTLTEPIQLTFQTSKWTIDTKQLLTLIDLTKGENLLSKEQTHFYLGQIASGIDQQVQEGQFDFNPQTKKVTAFTPSQEGRKLDLDKTYQLLTDAINDNSPKKIDLPVSIVKPKIQTSDVNSLGIKELLGRGISNFAGSIQNRIYNVDLTASKINGVLIPPGETFSFNQTVGDISAATGFKQAYVIKEGRTVLDDGGGVCQDSTTLFRAVLNAGLPVIKRTAHAYRVGYYEQGFPPGLDATVFYPSVDFQFKNDTPAHILIQAYTQGLTLYVDLYGTSDGRVATISKSSVTNQTPPPPELRQDDPTLPKGTVKQVDWSAWGATVKFNRTVTKNGQTLAQETWVSNYKPWQAVYLIGTQ